MKYCPECGSPLEPGDTFCINCGASLEETQTASQPVESRRRSSRSSGSKAVLIAAVCGGIILLAAAAFLILNSPQFVLSRAAGNTWKDLRNRGSVQTITAFLNGGSLKADANVSELLGDLAFLDSLDAKAAVEIGYSPEDTALVVNADASVSGMSALDAVLWITPDNAVLKSGAFLGQDAYCMSLRDVLPKSSARLLRELLTKAGSKPADALKKLVSQAFRYGEVTRETADGETVLRLTLDRAGAEKSLSRAFGVSAELPADFLMRFAFRINRSNRLTGISVRNDRVSYSLSLSPDPAAADTVSLQFESDLYDAEYRCSILEDNEEAFDADIHLLLNGNDAGTTQIRWNRMAGDFALLTDGTKITPAMTLKVNAEPHFPTVPAAAEEFAFDDSGSIALLSANINENVTGLLEELGLILPFSVEDTISYVLTDYVGEYVASLTGRRVQDMTEKELEDKVNEIAVQSAQTEAAEIAQSVATEAAGQISEETAERIARAVAEETVKKALSSSQFSSTPRASASDSLPADDAAAAGETASGDAGGLYSQVAGKYVYEEGAGYGIQASAVFDAGGGYTISCRSLFFNISDSGTYTIDADGNMSFSTNTSYKASGRYSNGRISLTIAGIATIELKKQ